MGINRGIKVQKTMAVFTLDDKQIIWMDKSCRLM